MKLFAILALFFLLFTVNFAQNEKAVIVLKGYDSVALIQGKKIKGKESFSVVRGRFKYLFATQANKQRFEKNPELYEVQNTTDLTGSGSGDFLRFRGFSGSYNNSYLRDGLKFPNYDANETADVERIEVLKGTSSVIYGRAEPGGVVNLVSKQPTSDNFISFDFSAGQFNFYRPQLDAGGKLFSDKLLYRLNFAYQYDGNFRDDADGKRVFVAPVLLWKPTEKLQISFDAEYLRERRGMDVGQLLVNGRVPNVPVERSYGEPFNRSFQQNKNGGIRGRYVFNSNWSIQSAYRTQFFDYALFGAFPALYFAPAVEADGRTVNRDLASIDFTERWHY